MLRFGFRDPAIAGIGYQHIAWIALGVVTAAIVYFLNIPLPPLSSTLLNWQKKGTVFKYKEFDIFYIVEEGIQSDGSTLVLIHGFPTSSHDWSKILGRMKSQFSRIIMLDMLGYGFSDKPLDHHYLITEQADIHEALLTSLSISRAHVMSHDYGDTVALELLHRFNNRESKFQLESMCMLNGGVFPETNSLFGGQKLLLTPVLGFILSHFTSYRNFKWSISRVFGVETQPTSDEMMDFYAIIQRKNGNVVKSRLIKYLNQRAENKDRWVGALVQTKIPVHMIYGPSDPVNSRYAFVDQYKKVVPSPSITVLEAAIGHYPHWEDPTAVFESYKSFLQSIKKP
ncbi:mesoderm-specific transcript homolog protein-like [Mya arenaria]|uniref:mesoderm-specific transcript homolog protein-like n=1 Tax=Mya arenaria TaxID=6604 RepID=UPI0022E23328|nr:mesoderm-specific transcript homolog protein-like [Mya arenaria]